MANIKKVLVNTTNNTQTDVTVVFKEATLDDLWTQVTFTGINNVLEMSDDSLVLNYGDERLSNKGQAIFSKGYWKCIKPYGMSHIYPTGAIQTQEQDFNM